MFEELEWEVLEVVVCNVEFVDMGRGGVRRLSNKFCLDGWNRPDLCDLNVASDINCPVIEARWDKSQSSYSFWRNDKHSIHQLILESRPRVRFSSVGQLFKGEIITSCTIVLWSRSRGSSHNRGVWFLLEQLPKGRVVIGDINCPIV